MAERNPIFSKKGDGVQIGYIEDYKAFNLFGRQRCNYSRETGNLCDSDNGKIVGHVSLEGKFVGESWIADELFGQPDPVAHTGLRSIPGIPRPSSQGGESAGAGESADAGSDALPENAAAQSEPLSKSKSDAGSEKSDNVPDELGPGPILCAPAPTESSVSADELLERAIRMVRDFDKGFRK